MDRAGGRGRRALSCHRGRDTRMPACSWKALPRCLLKLDAVARIERRLARDLAHGLIHAREARGVLIGIVAGIDLELVLDRFIGLDGFRAAQFWLVPALGVGRILVLRSTAVGGHRDRWRRRKGQRAPVVRSGRCRLHQVRRRYDALLTPTILRVSRLLRSEEHTSELQSLMRISYAVFCL